MLQLVSLMEATLGLIHFDITNGYYALKKIGAKLMI